MDLMCICYVDPKKKMPHSLAQSDTLQNGNDSYIVTVSCQCASLGRIDMEIIMDTRMGE